MNSHCWCQCCQELQLAARKAGFPQESAEVAGTPIAIGGEHGGFVLPAVHKSLLIRCDSSRSFTGWQSLTMSLTSLCPGREVRENQAETKLQSGNFKFERFYLEC